MVYETLWKANYSWCFDLSLCLSIYTSIHLFSNHTFIIGSKSHLFHTSKPYLECVRKTLFNCFHDFQFHHNFAWQPFQPLRRNVSKSRKFWKADNHLLLTNMVQIDAPAHSLLCVLLYHLQIVRVPRNFYSNLKACKLDSSHTLRWLPNKGTGESSPYTLKCQSRKQSTE